MKHSIYKAISSAICLVINMSVFADEVTVGSLKYELNGTEAYVSGYEGSPTDVVIPETIESEGLTFRVSQIKAEAFKQCNSITSLTSTGANLKSIGDNAFRECPNLKQVKLTCAEESSIGHYAFQACSSLEEVNTICSTIGYYTFYGCSNLQKVILSEVKSIGLIGIENYTDGSYYKTNTIGNTFANCSNLRYVDLGNKLETVSSYIFANCTKLSYIIIPSICVNYWYFSGSHAKPCVENLAYKADNSNIVCTFACK